MALDKAMFLGRMNISLASTAGVRLPKSLSTPGPDTLVFEGGPGHHQSQTDLLGCSLNVEVRQGDFGRRHHQ